MEVAMMVPNKKKRKEKENKMRGVECGQFFQGRLFSKFNAILCRVSIKGNLGKEPKYLKMDIL